MTNEEFNLSEKVEDLEELAGTNWIKLEDVKEFIRLLKRNSEERLKSKFKYIEKKEKAILNMFFNEINKLIGDKLK